MKIKFGLTFGLNVARLGLDETQVITAPKLQTEQILIPFGQWIIPMFPNGKMPLLMMLG